MITIPIWMFVSLVILLVVSLCGWGHTLGKAMRVGIEMYDRGRRHGDSSGFARATAKRQTRRANRVSKGRLFR